MVRRSLEWVAGSIVVYVLAACASKADLDGMMEIATGGIASMIGGTNGSGAEGSDGQGAESSGAQGAGAMGSDGSGAMGEGATGGTSIIDPVPEAEAAEDGTRIVNLYWTTADGLKTPAGFYDKDLDVQCSFMLTTDGVSRCLPTVATAFMGPSYFLDENCTQRAMLAQKGSCPPAAGQEAFAGEGTCGAS